MARIGGKIMTWALPVCGLVLLVAAAASAFGLPGMNRYETVRPVNGVVSIPVAQVSDGQARFYRYPDSGKELKFFVVKGGDGMVRAAFDACDVCFREKKGYVQRGEAMICKNCGMKFAIGRIGPHAVGGCNPSYLPHRQISGNVVISVGDLRSGSRFF
jgi:uncharacterized membrane protein